MCSKTISFMNKFLNLDGCALKQFGSKKNGLQEIKQNPCKWSTWPLSGSCRYSGRPWAICRPGSPYKARGPFGKWLDKPKLCAVMPKPPAIKMCKRPYLHYGESLNSGYIIVRRPCTPQKAYCKYPCYQNYQSCNHSC